MNIGANYEERWKNNIELPLYELEHYVKDMKVPFINGVVLEVCFSAGVPYRHDHPLMTDTPDVFKFLGTLTEIETKRAFLAHYLAEDAIVKYIRERRREQNNLSQLNQQFA